MCVCNYSVQFGFYMFYASFIDLSLKKKIVSSLVFNLVKNNFLSHQHYPKVRKIMHIFLFSSNSLYSFLSPLFPSALFHYPFLSFCLSKMLVLYIDHQITNKQNVTIVNQLLVLCCLANITF